MVTRVLIVEDQKIMQKHFEEIYSERERILSHKNDSGCITGSSLLCWKPGRSCTDGCTDIT